MHCESKCSICKAAGSYSLVSMAAREVDGSAKDSQVLIKPSNL